MSTYTYTRPYPYPMDATCSCGHDFGNHAARGPEHKCVHVEPNSRQVDCLCDAFHPAPAIPIEASSVTITPENPGTTPQELFEIAAMYDMSFLDLARICLLQHAQHSARPAAELANELRFFFEQGEKTLLDMLRHGPSVTMTLPKINKDFAKTMFDIMKNY